MTGQNNSRSKLHFRDVTPEQRIYGHCRLLDESTKVIAVRLDFLAADLYQIHPRARDALCGCLGNEGLAELVIRRIDACRGKGNDAKAQSIEELARAAIREHRR